MVHQPRRRRARVAALLLGALLMVVVVVGRQASDGPLTQPPARAATDGEPTTAATALLDTHTAPVFAALNRERAEAGLPALALDAGLVEDAASAACAMARGDLALSGDASEAGTDEAVRDNVGLVIEEDPAAGASAMHAWWAGTREHRRDRMDPAAARYGIGACGDGDRTYYVERLTPRRR